jgi:hypothetical protein
MTALASFVVGIVDALLTTLILAALAVGLAIIIGSFGAIAYVAGNALAVWLGANL